MKKVLFILSLIYLLMSSVCFADNNNNHCASIKKITGQVIIIRDNKEIKAKLGTKLFEKDSIKSGDDGSAGIIFQDDTLVSIGPNSELSMEEFEFDPKESKFGFGAKMLQGTFMFVSGVIGKLSPESVNLETPDGTIAVRGTKFLVQISQ